MRLYLRLAWRNVFRNKRRTFIAGSAIGIGLAALIFTDALMLGMERNMIRSATSSFLGEGQIHRKGFRDSYEADLTINRLDSVTTMLEEEPAVEHFTVRVLTQGMISSPANMRNVLVVGVNPKTEKFLSEIDDALVEGEYFPDGRDRAVEIGSDLAELLEVGLGDRIVITMSEAKSGDLSQEMFRVAGIYHFDVKELDRSTAFIRLDRARGMLGLPGQAHEIAIRFTDISYGESETLPFWDRYSRWGNEAISWIDIVPQLQVAMEMSQFSTWLVGLILFSVVALGIVNTLFMSLYERMFEFGVLRAVGTRPFALGRLVVFEAGALAVVSIVMGAVIGLIITLIAVEVGIDYSGIEFAGVTFRKLLYPVLTIDQFVRYPVLVFIITVVVGLYPAAYAAKMNAAEAMRKSI